MRPRLFAVPAACISPSTIITPSGAHGLTRAHYLWLELCIMETPLHNMGEKPWDFPQLPLRSVSWGVERARAAMRRFPQTPMVISSCSVKSLSAFVQWKGKFPPNLSILSWKLFSYYYIRIPIPSNTNFSPTIKFDSTPKDANHPFLF